MTKIWVPPKINAEGRGSAGKFAQFWKNTSAGKAPVLYKLIQNYYKYWLSGTDMALYFKNMKNFKVNIWSKFWEFWFHPKNSVLSKFLNIKKRIFYHNIFLLRLNSLVGKIASRLTKTHFFFKKKLTQK